MITTATDGLFKNSDELQQSAKEGYFRYVLHDHTVSIFFSEYSFSDLEFSFEIEFQGKKAPSKLPVIPLIGASNDPIALAKVLFRVDAGTKFQYLWKPVSGG